jgi:hypothetical protein
MRLRNIKIFTNDWFKAWQWFLLTAVNSPIKGLREEVRNRLDINLDRNILIDRLLRNSFTVKVGNNKFEETFYGKNVFAQSIHRELLWLWKIIHKWDVNFANHISPYLNFGFDTLVIYPDASSGATTCDGTVGYYESSAKLWSSIHGGTGNEALIAYSYVILSTAETSTYGRYNELTRVIATFDTSSLTNGAIISAASMQLYYYTKIDGLGQTSLILSSSNPAKNNDLVGSDNLRLGSINYGEISFTDFGSGYNSITLNSSGLNNINKIGISKFGFMLGWDFNDKFTGSWTAYTNTSYRWNDSDDVKNKPKLVITYTVPQISKCQMII